METEYKTNSNFKRSVARLISQYKMHSRQGLLPTFNIDKNINKILEKMKSSLNIHTLNSF